MKKKIQDYFPEEKKTVRVQAKVPVEIAEQVKKILDKQGIYLNDLVVASFKRFLDETKEGK